MYNKTLMDEKPYDGAFVVVDQVAGVKKKNFQFLLSKFNEEELLFDLTAHCYGNDLIGYVTKEALDSVDFNFSLIQNFLELLHKHHVLNDNDTEYFDLNNNKKYFIVSSKALDQMYKRQDDFKEELEKILKEIVS